MKPKRFEDFLNEYYLEHEDEGRSHNSSSAQENYERWLENLQTDDLIGLADKAVHAAFLAGMDRAAAIIRDTMTS